MTKSIRIVIDPIGRVVAEANGFQGVGCKAALDKILPQLGQVTGGEDKPEMLLQGEGEMEICQ